MDDADKVLLEALAGRAKFWRPAYEIASFTGEDVYTTRGRLSRLLALGRVERDRERWRARRRSVEEAFPPQSAG